MNEEKLRTMDSLGNLYSSQNLNPVFLIPGKYKSNVLQKIK